MKQLIGNITSENGGMGIMHQARVTTLLKTISTMIFFISILLLWNSGINAQEDSYIYNIYLIKGGCPIVVVWYEIDYDTELIYYKYQKNGEKYHVDGANVKRIDKLPRYLNQVFPIRGKCPENYEYFNCKCVEKSDSTSISSNTDSTSETETDTVNVLPEGNVNTSMNKIKLIIGSLIGLAIFIRVLLSMGSDATDKKKSQIRIFLIGFTIAGLGLFYYLTMPPLNKSFIIGKWERSKIGNEKNILTYIFFNSDGSFESGNSDGPIYTDCKYTFYNKKEIDCVCLVKGRSAAFTLTLKNKNSTLVNSFGDQYTKEN